ncbi:MAG: thiamine pyrophosphate-binding protein [Bacteriovoracia bacterium]
MMTVSDYIFKYLADKGVRHVFLVTGGGAMYLNDALKKESRIQFVCNHHEQACAIAAEGYSRTKGELSVVSVTTGPGALNALTGVMGQWTDSVPVLYISGQVKYETTMASDPEPNLRQLGDQEVDIIQIVKPITKYAKMVTDPSTIRMELEKAIHEATTGRYGPVWLDIPINVQGAKIDETTLLPFDVPKKEDDFEKIDNLTTQVANLLQTAKRPILVAGHGIRLAKAQNEFERFIERTKIPVATTFNGVDLLESDSPYFVGRIGTIGSRSGNFALQNADLVICLGTRNNIRQVSYNWKSFARHAKLVIIDIDKAELHKKTVNGDILGNVDARDFLKSLLEKIPENFSVSKSWLDWGLERRKKYPVVLEEYKNNDRKDIHPYPFMETLTSMLDKDAIAIAANGSACVVLFQAAVVKKGQRYFWNSGCASMGYDLPASIGASLAANRDVICFAGDGSIQMNLQELQTIRHYNLPVKIILLNNDGYQSIKQTQSSFFNKNFIGCDKDSGLTMPDASKLAALYDIEFIRIEKPSETVDKVKQLLSYKGPVLCEVMLDTKYSFAPKLSSERKPDGTIISKPLEDLFPFLDRKEFESNMLVKDSPTEN